MTDFFYRTEDIAQEEILRLFVETPEDRKIVDSIKGRNPVIVIGSRGVGKSFLLRVAQAELRRSYAAEPILPVYMTFTQASLLHTSDPLQFQHWMLARICDRVVRALAKLGLLADAPKTVRLLAGDDLRRTRIQRIVQAYEDSYKQPGTAVDSAALPTLEQLKDVLEDTCTSLRIKRFQLFFDEAAHIFRPEHQRQFFSLFRDLRSPFVCCNAAVYPGVTAYGQSFQPAHDATLLQIDRNILASDYTDHMLQIVERQADSGLLDRIARNRKNFQILAYASNGNPRILLKTVSRAPRMRGDEVNETIRAYYRSEIWSEHSSLVDKYGGHRTYVDWGRQFIEETVLPEMQQKNAQYLAGDKNTTCFFWVHRDAPQPVKEALRVLEYTGIVVGHAEGIRATRSEVGTRYAVNLGCLFALEATPTSTAFDVAKNLTPKRMTEFGQNHPVYRALVDSIGHFVEPDMTQALARQLEKPIDILDVTEWQKTKLRELGLEIVGSVLSASEEALQEASYVGEKRSRRMRNAAIAAVYEYLSG